MKCNNHIISNKVQKIKLYDNHIYSTNGKYIPSIRKCVISKRDIEFNEEVMKLLKISETDKKELEDDDVLHIELENIEDFEKE